MNSSVMERNCAVWLPDPYGLDNSSGTCGFALLETYFSKALPEIPEWAVPAQKLEHWDALITTDHAIAPDELREGCRVLVSSREAVAFAHTLIHTLESCELDLSIVRRNALFGTALPYEESVGGICHMIPMWYRAGATREQATDCHYVPAGTDVLITTLILPDEQLPEDEIQELLARQFVVTSTASTFDMIWDEDMECWYQSPFLTHDPCIAVAVAYSPNEIDLHIMAPEQVKQIQVDGELTPNHLSSKGIAKRIKKLPGKRRRWFERWSALNNESSFAGETHAVLCSLEIEELWHAPNSAACRQARRTLRKARKRIPSAAAAVETEVLAGMPSLSFGAKDDTLQQIHGLSDRFCESPA